MTKPILGQITDHIWLGNLAAAVEDELLESVGIKGVLNVCERQYIYEKMNYFCCPLRDNYENLAKTIDAAAQLLDELLQRGAPVFIHCKEGGSRSVAVLMWWLVSRGHAPGLSTARQDIQRKYPLKLSDRQPRPGLMKLLYKLESQLMKDRSNRKER